MGRVPLIRKKSLKWGFVTQFRAQNSADLGVLGVGAVIANDIGKTNKKMILEFLFPYLSLSSQVSRLQNDGLSLGTRIKNGRKIYVYMLRDLFVEVLYLNDSPGEPAERVNVLKGVKNLNAHLEKEFRASF